MCNSTITFIWKAATTTMSIVFQWSIRTKQSWFWVETCNWTRLDTTRTLEQLKRQDNQLYVTDFLISIVYLSLAPALKKTKTSRNWSRQIWLRNACSEFAHGASRPANVCTSNLQALIEVQTLSFIAGSMIPIRNDNEKSSYRAPVQVNQFNGFQSERWGNVDNAATVFHSYLENLSY